VDSKSPSVECFDTVIWVAGRASVLLQLFPKVTFGTGLNCSNLKSWLDKEKLKVDEVYVDRVSV